MPHLLFAEMMWLGLHLADWLVLVVYFVMVLVIGVFSYLKVKDMADYFMGGRRFGKIFMMFFAFGSGTSSEQAISVVAGAWRVGLAGIWWQFLWLWATPFYWIVAPVMRRMRALTTADFFEHRFSTSTATLYSIMGIIISIVFISTGLFSSGKMVNALTGGELQTWAEELDYQVPEIKWESKYKRFGRGILLTLDSAESLQEGNISDELRTSLAAKTPLSDEVTLKSGTANDSWEIVDHKRGVTYPVQKTEEDGKPIWELFGSGWRQVQGYEFAILAMTILFVTYGIAGGLGAAIVTDFIQGMLTIAFSFLLLPFVFHMIGGFGQLHLNSGMKPYMLELTARPEVAAALGREPITIYYVFMLALTAIAGIVVQPHIMGVCGAGKTEFEGRFGFTVGNFLKRFCTIAWTFIGLACLVWYLGDNSPLKKSDKPEDRATYQALRERANFMQFQTKLLEREISQNGVDAEVVTPAGFEQQDRIKQEEFWTSEFENLQQQVNQLPEQRQTEINSLLESERKRIDTTEKAFADELFGKAAYDVLPTVMHGLLGLLLASLLAAVMSTSDAQMVVSSGLFTENIYKRFLVKNRSAKHYLWVGRIAGLLIVLVAIVLQSSFSDVIDALKVVIKTPACIGISLWIGIIWRGWTPAAVWVSTIASSGTWALSAFRPDLFKGVFSGLHATLLPVQNGALKVFKTNEVVPSANVPFTDLWQMALYISVGVLVGYITSLLTKRTPKEKLDHFFDLIHTPVRPGEEIPAPCTLPENPLPKGERMFRSENIELPKPSVVGMTGFIAAWIGVGFLIWLTTKLAQWL